MSARPVRSLCSCRAPPRPFDPPHWLLVALTALPIVSACAPVPPSTGDVDRGPTSGRAPAAAAAEGSLPPLEAPSPLVELPVPGHGAMVVSLPLGATTPRPVVVAAHGAGDRPDWQCRAWRDIVGDRAFVACPRGFPMDPRLPPSLTGYFYTTHLQLGKEVTAALAALAARYPDHLDPSAPVYAGFSQGAIMGALLLPHHPARFARAVLIEGGYGGFQEWNLQMARWFRERDGRSVLLACGRAQCADEAERSAGYMQREGLQARVVHAPGAGHTYGGAVWDEVARAFPWLVSGDERF